MESLKQWLQQFTEAKHGTQDDIAEKWLHDPHIQAWCDAHPQLDVGTQRAHVLRLAQYARDRVHCTHCPGLARCPHDMQGHYTTLEVVVQGEQHTIVDRQTPCNLYVAYASQQYIRARIKSFYVDERALTQEYTHEEIIGRDLRRATDVEKVIDYIKSVSEQQTLPPKGLYLYGDFGTGKTFLASYLLYELAKKGYTGVIVFMPDFIEDLKRLMHDREALHETLVVLRETDLLVLDDIGAEQLNAWARDHVVGSILNYRMNRKPTFYTSNQTIDQLTQHLSFTMRDGEDAYKGKRLVERIAPYVTVIEVRGDNQRQRGHETE